MIRTIIIVALAVIATPTAAPDAHSQPQQQRPTVRCIKDSFGNLRCDDGTTVLHDSWGNPIIIPPPPSPQQPKGKSNGRI
jgi:hypothetical protein